MKTHTDPLGFVSRNTYDTATGNLTETRQVGNPSDGTDDIVAQNSYGAGGVLTQTTDPTGTVTKFGYSAEGFPLSTRLVVGADDSPAAGDDILTTTQPDAMSRPTKQFDARGFETDFTYDAAGRVKKTTALGNPADPGDDVVTENFYDAAGRLFKTKDPLGHERMTIYDAVTRDVRGNMRSHTDPRGYAT